MATDPILSKALMQNRCIRRWRQRWITASQKSTRFSKKLAAAAILFDENGTLFPQIKATAPTGTKRLGSTPYANGGLLPRELNLPDFRQHDIQVEKPAGVEAKNTRPLGVFLRDVMRNNMTTMWC